MAGNQQRTLEDYGVPMVFEEISDINRPPLPDGNYEFSSQLIRMIKERQFEGRGSECPYTHLAHFVKLCNNINEHNATQEQTRLHLFHFSLDGRALAWLESLPANSVTTWAEVTKAFLRRFILEEKTVELKRQIATFSNLNGETLSEAWERFKDLRRACPHHGYDLDTLLRSFYDGLNPITRANLDVSAGGWLLKINLNDVEATIEEVARHSGWSGSGQKQNTRSANKIDVDNYEALASKLEVVMKKLDKINLASSSSSIPINVIQPCETCGGCDHVAAQCMATLEQVAAVGARNDPYAPTFNPGWKNHPNFGVNVITLRLGKTYEGPVMKEVEVEKGKSEIVVEKKIEEEKKKEVENEKQKSDKNKEEHEKENGKGAPTQQYLTPIRFRQKFATKKLNDKLSQFLQLMKGIQINIPFLQAIKEMPAYATFLKDLLTHRDKLDDATVFHLPQNVSAIIQGIMSEKKSGPSAFLIPVKMECVEQKSALVDLGAGVS
ncbi:uncharacterized protein LOC109134561 [Beta vulgaris subsp. vulgaris]|uniref:uncharacterized protein LOC109134561 n=1 Tax=Beta vulgaris subsp. vulgaris TaxID=3555 RepID=UPI0020372582|nr:uncharacterized protein LOC109134561 [Beta vulgaris subsp. vulgaris]